MSMLFDPGHAKQIPDELLIEALEWGRTKFECNEDDWLEPELSQVRERLGEGFSDISLHLLSKTLIRLRKDKKCITPKTGKSMAQRLGRLCRDYNRMRSRRDKLWHSKQYDEYIHSQAWLDRASQHRRECEFRCQLCGRSGKLDVHHTPEGYKYLGREQCTHLIAVCRIPCHAIADFLRETKGNIESAD